MSSSDLRKGNIVKNQKGETILITADQIAKFDKGIEIYHPVTLDDDFFDFNHFRKNSIEYYLTVRSNEIFCIKRNEEGFFVDVAGFSRVLRFVHELQNIFYIATQQELL